jgi:hypothetical protein
MEEEEGVREWSVGRNNKAIKFACNVSAILKERERERDAYGIVTLHRT